MKTSQETFQKTPLYAEHLSRGARMVGFGGWEMPVQYEGILAEYEHTRRAVSLFDTSHMGEFVITGDCFACGLDRLVTMSIVDMPLLSCRYGMILNEQGGIIDDLIVFRQETQKWFIVVNGATTAKDVRHFRQNLKTADAFEDVSFKMGKIDVQGPMSRDVLKTFARGIENLEYYTFGFFNFFGVRVLISRTGYTGELGYEIYCPWDQTAGIWRELLKNENVKPAGLGARDILRLEVGYSLYGHELEENVTPLEAGLERFVDFQKDFIGKEALLRQQKEGIPRKVAGFTSETRRAPRQNQMIFSEANEEIGRVTSGSFSPHCQKGIGLGFVREGYAARGKKIFFGDDKSKNNAILTGRIFYKRGSLKD